jgi:hypothetical protein
VPVTLIVLSLAGTAVAFCTGTSCAVTPLFPRYSDPTDANTSTASAMLVTIVNVFFGFVIDVFIVFCKLI